MCSSRRKPLTDNTIIFIGVCKLNALFHTHITFTITNIERNLAMLVKTVLDPSEYNDHPVWPQHLFHIDSQCKTFKLLYCHATFVRQHLSNNCCTTVSVCSLQLVVSMKVLSLNLKNLLRHK